MVRYKQLLSSSPLNIFNRTDQRDVMKSRAFVKLFEAILILLAAGNATIFSVAAQDQPPFKSIPATGTSHLLQKTFLNKESKTSLNRVGTAYTLNDCYTIALDKNIGLAQARNNINGTKIDLKTAQYGLLPSVSYSLGHFFSFGKNIDPVTNTYVNE